MSLRIVLLILGLSLPLSAFAQGPVPPEDPVDEDAGEMAMDREADLEAFVDGIVAARMDSDRLAGATVAVVHRGEVQLLKGYGKRDGDGTPVDAEKTLFRIASISKPFVWVALMQLDERGLISLDDPANDHLPDTLQLPPGLDGEPIRIHHLMSHNAGFEDSALGHLLEREVENLRPLNEYLDRVRPELVRPPGELATYSNWASALAGALVAEVSGLGFEEYVEEYIFAPLGMERSTFRETYSPDEVHEDMPAPVAEELAEHFAEGFREQAGVLEPAYFEYLAHTAPSGGMSATAADMANFMLALLNEGELNGDRILADDTARRMSQTRFSNAEGMNGLAHGFIEYRFDNGLRGYGHGGALVHFFSGMVLVPELELGIFVSTNTAGGRGFSQALPRHVVARFQAEPGEQPEAAGNDELTERLEDYAGSYRHPRRSYSGVEKITAIDNVMKVDVHDDGYLITHMGGQTRRWLPVDGQVHLFERVDGPDRLAFGESPGGDINRFYHPSGINAGERIGFFGTGQWLFTIMGITGLAALWQLGGFWIRRRQRLNETTAERTASCLMLAWSLGWISALVLAWQAMSAIRGAGAENLFLWPLPILQGWVLINNLAVLLSLLAVISIVPLWRTRTWSLRQRLYHIVAVFAGLALAMTLNDWNLIGWRF